MQIDTPTPTPTPWLTPREAADRAKVGLKQVYYAIKTGKLKAARVGATRRIHEAWLDAWLAAAAGVVNPDAPGDPVALPFRQPR
jgi:excisionase family DNA binding protein